MPSVPPLVYARAAVLALVLAMLVPVTSEAATYTLRPNSTVTNSPAWTLNPTTGSTVHGVLDDAVLQPTAPSTTSDFIRTNASGRIAEIGMDTQQLASGDAVTSTVARVYALNGNSRTITMGLYTGSTLLGNTSIPAGGAAAWRTFTSSTALTQAQVDDLRIRFTSAGTGSQNGTVFAAYVSLTTAGVLNESTSGGSSFSVALNGTNQLPTYEVPIRVNDTRNTSSGWSLSASTTQFSTGGANADVLPANASTVTSVASECAVQPCTNPTNSRPYPIALSGSSVKIFNAATNTGSGQFTVTPITEVSVPANANVGCYRATVTYTIANGP